MDKGHIISLHQMCNQTGAKLFVEADQIQTKKTGGIVVAKEPRSGHNIF